MHAAHNRRDPRPAPRKKRKHPRAAEQAYQRFTEQTNTQGHANVLPNANHQRPHHYSSQFNPPSYPNHSNSNGAVATLSSFGSQPARRANKTPSFHGQHPQHAYPQAAYQSVSPLPDASPSCILVKTVAQCRDAVANLSKSTRIAVDCEGVLLSRTGKLCLVQIANEHIIYIFDIIGDDQDYTKSHGNMLFRDGGLKALLENSSICKVMHDCRHDSDALYHQFNVTLGPVIDTQVTFCILRRAMGLEDGLPVSLKTLLKKFSLINNSDLQVKNDIKSSMANENDFWLRRPLSKTAVWYAKVDVQFLLTLSETLLNLIIQMSKSSSAKNEISATDVWKSVLKESLQYVKVFRDDVNGPRKAELRYELMARIAKRQRLASKMNEKSIKHKRNDPLNHFTFNHSSIVDALNG